MPTSTRPLPCSCPDCAPPAAPAFGALTTWFIVIAFVLMPGRALLHLIWGAVH